MPLIKLNRINKGGEIYVNSDHILFMEVEYRTTTIHMIDSLLFSVEEQLKDVMANIEKTEAERIAEGIRRSGLSGGSPIPTGATASSPPTAGSLA